MAIQIEELQYPIGKESTTVGNILKNLRILRGAALHRALRDGCITVDGQVVPHTWTRVNPDQVVAWAEYRITVRLDNTDKAQRLLVEGFRSSGLRGNNRLGGPVGLGGGSAGK